MLLATAAGRCPAADWTDTRNAGPFICRADFSLAAYDGLLRELAQLQTDLSQTLGIAAASEPIEVYLFHDQATYARYLGRYLPGVPYRRALYAKGDGPGRVFAYQGGAVRHRPAARMYPRPAARRLAAGAPLA